MKTNKQAQKNNTPYTRINQGSNNKFILSIIQIIAMSVFYLLALSIPGMAGLTGAALFFATLALIFTSVFITSLLPTYFYKENEVKLLDVVISTSADLTISMAMPMLAAMAYSVPIISFSSIFSWSAINIAAVAMSGLFFFSACIDKYKESKAEEPAKDTNKTATPSSSTDFIQKSSGVRAEIPAKTDVQQNIASDWANSID